MKQMKFVEWPVVLRIPRRSDVLYTGHAYEGVSTMSDFRCGLNHMIGALENSTCRQKEQKKHVEKPTPSCGVNGSLRPRPIHSLKQP